MSLDGQNPVTRAALLREAREGIDATVKLFRSLGIDDGQIVLMFRDAADALEKPIIETVEGKPN